MKMNPGKRLIGCILLFLSFGRLSAEDPVCAYGTVNLIGFLSDGGSGTYSDPATGKVEVDFCFTLLRFYENNTNWVHGVFVAWDQIPVGAKVCEGPTGSQNTQHGSRRWIFIDSSKARLYALPGPGYYVDEGDGNPTNNYGDNGNGTPNASFPDLLPFCFKMKMDCGVTPATSFVAKVTVTGDGSTGGWTNLSCKGDLFRAETGGPNGNGSVVVCGLVLPVQLVQFSGEASPVGNQLYWEASADQLFSHFEIERSTATVSAFESIARVDLQKGAAVNEILRYDYLDMHHAALSYYRLKMVEKDGSYKYSPIISIKQDLLSQGGKYFSLFPNPASSFLVIRNESAEQYGILCLNLIDTYGRSIFCNNVESDLQHQKYVVDLNQVPAGFYILKISHGERTLETLGFTKQ